MADEQRRIRPIFLWGGLIGLVLIGVVVFVFEPQTLFIDEVVDEDFPVGAQPEPGDTPMPESEVMPDDPPMDEPMPEDTATAEPAGPTALSSAAFRSRSHPTEGTATIYELEDGQLVLRLEDLATDNGPALFVYLSGITPDGPANEVEDVYLDLGVLKGNIGDQNYDIPPGTDLTQFNSVVIWCERFAVVFGTAEIDLA